LLTVISYTELLIEMAARRRLGPEKRWRVVLALECLKAALRLNLASVTARMVVHPAIAQREIDPNLLDQHQQQQLLSASNNDVTPGSDRSTSLVTLNGFTTPDRWVGCRTGLERPTIASLRARSASHSELDRTGNLDPFSVEDGKKEVNEYLLSRVLTVEEVRKPEELVRRLDGRLARFAELVWILRPVIYGVFPQIITPISAPHIDIEC